MFEEKTLVNSLKNGDQTAFICLYDRYRLRLYNFVYASIQSEADSQDVVQIVFMRLWEHRSQLDSQLQFSAYLFKIARNLVYNHLRDRLYKKLDAKLSEAMESVVGDEAEIGTVIENDFRIYFANLIEKIPERRRQIFIMSRHDHKSYSEIAKELNISENTVDTQIRKSLDFLRKHLNKEELILLFMLGNSLKDTF